MTHAINMTVGCGHSNKEHCELLLKFSAVIMLGYLLLSLWYSPSCLCCAQSEWLFSLRAIPHCGPLFADLEKSLSSCFLLDLFGVEVSATERQLFLFLCSLEVLVFLT